MPLNMKRISECYIRPKFDDSNPSYSQPIYLTPWDLFMLPFGYMQKGLIFANPPPSHNDDEEVAEEETYPSLIQKEAFLEKLKSSLTVALVHFYPLVGRLTTQIDEDDHSCLISIDCQKGRGAKFIHAALDVTLDDVLSPASDVPRFVDDLFDKEPRLNHDGPTAPLLSIQVTDLVDGVFLACTMNHAVADGTSFWHFIKMWSEIFKTKGDMSTTTVPISRPPIHKRWFPDGCDPIVRLPYTQPHEFQVRYESPQLRQKIFHFSSDSLARLKAKANAEYCNSENISTFQAMAALVWISITRARSLPGDQQAICYFLCNNRQRLNPPLSQDYFGNSIQPLMAATKTADLLKHDSGSAALLLKQAVQSHTDKSVRDWFSEFIESPFVYQTLTEYVGNYVALVGSPRFDVYGNEFGLGKPLQIRGGRGGKSDGVVVCYPGYEGGGSVDLEIYLAPESMAALESDPEFMALVS